MIVRTLGDTTGKTTVSIVHEDSGSVIETMAPKDNGGEGLLFSPTDLCATSLGTCMLSIMAIVARRHGWAIEGTRVRVVKTMVADPERRIGGLEVRFGVPGEHDESARQTLEKAARTCPVALSLSDGIEVETAFEWGIVAPAQPT